MSLIRYAHEKMYKMLKNELRECIVEGPCKNSVEKCFIVAGNYWSELRSTIAEYKFQTEEEELLFFKTVKPLFTTELEYYSLLYHALLFCPIDIERQRQFWEREAKRLEDFKVQHKEFVDYSSSGDSSKDEIYYLKPNHIYEPDKEIETFGKEPKDATGYDNLISKWWALERYSEYAKCKLKEIHKLI